MPEDRTGPLVEGGEDSRRVSGGCEDRGQAMTDDEAATVVIRRDGLKVAEVLVGDEAAWFLWHVSHCSMAHALEHEGWSCDPSSNPG